MRPRFITSKPIIISGVILAGVVLGFVVNFTLTNPAVSAFFSKSKIMIFGYGEEIIPSEHQGKLLLFILAGQSNMSGRAPILQTEVEGNIFVFGNDYQWRLARRPVDDATNQIDLISLDELARHGPGLSFSQSLQNNNAGMVIGLIPCAKGGSAISEWQRDLLRDSLYGSCLYRAQQAAPMGTITGILFFQGEQDALAPVLNEADVPLSSNNYAQMFTGFATAFRMDLGLPKVPIIFAQIGSTEIPENFPNWDMVKAEQASIELDCSSMISTDDLDLMDGLHFTQESYDEIGIRFAEAYLKLTNEFDC